VIYSLLAAFGIYSALPDEWVPSRNNTLVYDDIGYLYVLNMFINAIWLFLFPLDNAFGFVAGLIDIAVMLTTNFMILQKSLKSSVNWIEWITLRGGYSIYSGWVTAATILNVTYMLKYFGLSDPILDGAVAVTEEKITVIILYVAFAIYTAVSYIDRNPAYGSVFEWVIVAIWYNIVNNKSQYTDISDNALALAIANGISMVVQWTFLAAEKVYEVGPTDPGIGIFYKLWF